MQMSVFLALVQTFLAAASLGVALLALDSGDPPHSDGSQTKKWRELGTLATGTSLWRPGPSGLNPVL